MERMLVVVFDDETKAYEGKSALRQLESEDSLTVYRVAVIAKNTDGTTSVKQYDEWGPAGGLVGTSIGALIGMLGGPVGLAVGAFSGLALGSVSDVDKAQAAVRYVEEVSQALAAGKVAVAAEVEESWTAPVDTRMQPLGGAVIRFPLWEIRGQLHRDEIAELKADLAHLKEEIATANANRRSKLQSRIDQLQARLDLQKKHVQEWLETLQARGAVKRDLLKKNASAVGQAIKELVKPQST